jgi:hypothetical protein
VTDSYYELIDAADPSGEKFRATDLARGTWSASIQHGGPVSALLVRALERCEQRDDTRLSRVVIDLLGGVPAEGDMWVSSGRWRAPVDGGCSSRTRKRWLTPLLRCPGRGPRPRPAT